MSHVRRARLAAAVAALSGVLLSGCASQAYSDIVGSSPPTPSASATPTPSASPSASQSVLVPPSAGTTGDVSNLKAAAGFKLPSTVGSYRLSTDPQLQGIYQKSGSPTDIFTAQVTAVSVDAGEIAKSLFGGGAKQISGSYCGQIKGQPAECIRQLNGGYLQVSGSGSKTMQDVAGFAGALYQAA